MDIELARPRYLLKVIDNYSGDRFLLYLLKNALGKFLVDQFTLYDESIPENFSHGKVHGNVKPIKTQREMLKLVNEEYDSKTCIKLMTYNAYNFESGPWWDQRQQMIAKMIKLYQPDVIGFQEMRISYVLDQNMVEDLSKNLPEYNYIYSRAHYFWNLGMEEGLAIFSKIPILKYFLSLFHLKVLLYTNSLY